MTDYQDYARSAHTGATPYPSADPMRVPRTANTTGIVVTLGIIVIAVIALFAFSGTGDNTVRDTRVQTAPAPTTPAPAGQAEQPTVPATPQIAPGGQAE